MEELNIFIYSYFKKHFLEMKKFESYEEAKAYIRREAEDGATKFEIHTEDYWDSVEINIIEKRTHEEDGDWWQDAHNPNKEFWTESLNIVYS